MARGPGFDVVGLNNLKSLRRARTGVGDMSESGLMVAEGKIGFVLSLDSVGGGVGANGT